MKEQLPRNLRFASLAEALTELSALQKARSIRTVSPWSVPQTLTHCAQSIEYTMTGFPSMRSFLVRKWLGPMVLRRFQSKGQMSHSLDEPIPGAPALSDRDTLEQSLARLRKAIADFNDFQGPLQPHFAYGVLSKPDAEMAHAMHIANHLSAMTYE